jgi:hypothetical protein
MLRRLGERWVPEVGGSSITVVDSGFLVGIVGETGHVRVVTYSGKPRLEAGERQPRLIEG